MLLDSDEAVEFTGTLAEPRPQREVPVLSMKGSSQKLIDRQAQALNSFAGGAFNAADKWDMTKVGG